ncbi:PulJ/GspJ family protein [Chrysiogenes arsenatis]|uniref:PulJ/GspJ family protein n=1 Tax=Chrysiogenes arsenatis TaxID=309797 RepID=UPI0004161E64|nr:type II secretion system protein [Chrysiogenes arsenatis]
MKRHTAGRGFTLVEILVALAISSILYALGASMTQSLMSSVERGREQDRLLEGHRMVRWLARDFRMAVSHVPFALTTDQGKLLLVTFGTTHSQVVPGQTVSVAYRVEEHPQVPGEFWYVRHEKGSHSAQLSTWLLPIREVHLSVVAVANQARTENVRRDSPPEFLQIAVSPALRPQTIYQTLETPYVLALTPQKP